LEGISDEIEQIAQKDPTQAKAIKSFATQKLGVNELMFDAVKKSSGQKAV
jgi:hypothetical protein